MNIRKGGYFLVGATTVGTSLLVNNHVFSDRVWLGRLFAALIVLVLVIFFFVLRGTEEAGKN